ncbi:MAG: hypothetical protein BAJALOKI1v1_830009 [Promethearchaeota archaeon]|nr:MAG: hypothetical protein BAJALOKI1v1_830009 [Candidatus Lokiarchaeota archaeon]
MRYGKKKNYVMAPRIGIINVNHKLNLKNSTGKKYLNFKIKNYKSIV